MTEQAQQGHAESVSSPEDPHYPLPVAHSQELLANGSKNSKKPLAWVAEALGNGSGTVVVTGADGNILLVMGDSSRTLGVRGDELLGKPLSILGLNDPRKSLAAVATDIVSMALDQECCQLDLACGGESGDRSMLRATIGRIAVEDGPYLIIVLRAADQSASGQSAAIPSDELRRLAAASQQKTEIEKKHASRELYDDLGQQLSALTLDLEWLQAQSAAERADIGERLVNMQQLLKRAIVRTKEIAGSLHPPLLDDLGLVPAIEWISERFRRTTGIACTVQCADVALRAGDPLESAIFRLIQEGLLNVERHAHATAASIALARHGGEIEIVIEDNGIGLAPEDASKPGCHGLRAMQERVYVLGGTITCDNLDPSGFAIRASIPVEQSSNWLASL